ncbi:MAG: hypothetical protein [Circular genetic element sp.]|nr:MAG: hypothetical protein [Circular genetic element sp.]
MRPILLEKIITKNTVIQPIVRYNTENGGTVNIRLNYPIPVRLHIERVDGADEMELAVAVIEFYLNIVQDIILGREKNETNAAYREKRMTDRGFHFFRYTRDKGDLIGWNYNKE